MKYSIALIMVLSGCSVIPADLIKSAEEVQADNAKYWAEVAEHRADIIEVTQDTEVAQATGVVLQEAVPVDVSTRTYKLEVYPLGP